MGQGGKSWISYSSTAISNFAVQYNFQSIAITLLIMSASVCTSDDGNCKQGEQKSWVSGTSSAVIFIGAVVGQLSMGFLGDLLSRNVALAATLSISALGALLSAVAPAGDATSTYAVIILFRFIIGIGLGGIYPLSATKSSEDNASADPKTGAYGAASAYVWQIPGTVAPWLVGYLLTYSSLSTGLRWRMVLGLGAVPCVLAIACLLYEEHTKRVKFIDDVSMRTTAQVSPKSDLTLAMVVESMKDPDNFRMLIGCAGSWLLFDIVFYGLTLLGGVVINAIADEDDDVSSDANVRIICSKQSIALSVGLVGVYCTVLLLGYMNLKYVQVAGFLMQGFFIMLFACFFHYLKQNSPDGLFVLYILCLMSLQFGVAVATYCMPAALFNKNIRSTYNGIAAAGGKVGAIIGAYTFPSIAEASIEAVLATCVVVCALGIFFTHHYIRTSDLEKNNPFSRHYIASAADSPTVRFSSSGAGKDTPTETFSPMFGNNRSQSPIVTTQLSFNAVDAVE
eukprot:CAMPEP_0184977066 /NCGR_PEP_ID=MMETSP1098-20130426/7834_1 /TAXON_ID=89044 /ORGANISM="Spumella elongata, Strain CCAP 955/1" /LENGTH=508 /DNA_ID=CAMNT_0027500011 /DNA_START=79 /DNA_END=1605 /DNA_ORIENTATION=+